MECMDEFEILLLNLLKKSNGTIIISNLELFMLLECFPIEIYRWIKGEKLKGYKYTDLKINEFLPNFIIGVIHEKVKVRLERLENKNKIITNRVVEVVDAPKDDSEEEDICKIGNIYYEREVRYDQIIKIYDEAATEMGYSSIGRALHGSKIGEYLKLVKERIFEKFGFKKVFLKLQINLKDENLEVTSEELYTAKKTWQQFILSNIESRVLSYSKKQERTVKEIRNKIDCRQIDEEKYNLSVSDYWALQTAEAKALSEENIAHIKSILGIWKKIISKEKFN